MSEAIQFIPAKTVIYAPDELNRVTLQFKTQDDAIVFYQMIQEMCRSKEPCLIRGKG